MESLYILIPIALIFVALAVAIFFWAVKSGQYDDLDAEGKRILFDRDNVDVSPKKTAEQNVETLSEKNTQKGGDQK